MPEGLGDESDLGLDDEADELGRGGGVLGAAKRTAAARCDVALRGLTMGGEDVSSQARPISYTISARNSVSRVF